MIQIQNRLSVNALEQHALASPGVVIRAFVVGVAAFVAVGIGWMAVCEIDIRAHGTGQIVPAGQNKVVQNLEGGIVTEILVKPGDTVAAGQVLAKLSPKAYEGDLRDRQVTAAGLKAAVARLDAEAKGQEPGFPADLRKDAPDVVRDEVSLHRQRLATLESQTMVLENQRRERQAELSDLEVRVPQLRKSLRLVTDEIKVMKGLVEGNAAAPAELTALEKEASVQRIQLNTALETIPRARAAVSEASHRIAEKHRTFQSEAMAERNEKQVKLLALQGSIEARGDQVKRTAVLAPVAGVVKTLHVTTVGEVVGPGRTIADIVPAGESLTVETRIAPSDIGFVSPGQPVSVRLSAFDYAIYGSLEGKVERISPDTVKDEQDPRQIFYQVLVRTQKSHLDGPHGRLEVIPGMIADVDIMTGRRTVLDYLLKPLTRARVTAMRER